MYYLLKRNVTVVVAKKLKQHGTLITRLQKSDRKRLILFLIISQLKSHADSEANVFIFLVLIYIDTLISKYYIYIALLNISILATIRCLPLVIEL